MSYMSEDKTLAPQFQYTSDNYVGSTKTFSDQTTILFNERTLYNSGTAFIQASPPNVTNPRLTISVPHVDQYIWHGEIMMMSQSRTNSPVNARFRHFAQRYRFQAYSDGDCDASGFNQLLLDDDMQGGAYRAGYGVFSYCSTASPPAGYSWNSGHLHFYFDIADWQAHPLWIKITTSNAADRQWKAWWS